MKKSELHTFHIPVMGLCYTIDTPIKVARFGISSVVSIIADELIEQMREFYYKQIGEPYHAITKENPDCRAMRITDYLNLLNRIINKQVEDLRKLPFNPNSDIVKYFELLPDDSSLKALYLEMTACEDATLKKEMQEQLRKKIAAGKIDVNIMSKLDRNNYREDGQELPQEFSDALSALRGFAKSDVSSSMVFSAGYNPRLYSYIEEFPDFFPDKNGNFKKKVILKVSDFRSALIQGKILAKKGVWISEFRVESGLNCGGHAFPTEGYLLGPILEEFKQKRESLVTELSALCHAVWIEKGITNSKHQLTIDISAQGGIGTANEDIFLREHYHLCSTGWGSPFLMVPECTNVDEETLNQLVSAKKEDYYLSYASPLGIPFNNFKNSSSEEQRLNRAEKGRPGSPCYKKSLASDTEFTTIPICTASREYQDLKIKQLQTKSLDAAAYKAEFNKIIEKDCLCEGLGVAALLKNHLHIPHKLSAVTICPGPNLAYFSKIVSLGEMIGHIYGRINLLNTEHRPNMFINELYMYVEYLKNEIIKLAHAVSINQNRYLQKFKTNLLEGIEYYKNLVPSLKLESEKYLTKMSEELNNMEQVLKNLMIPSVTVSV
ncbi:MAG: hypothetical protein ACYDCN_13215 [Bacteroidia bacterium]